ncbi:MAG: mechanosensitive ion channel family protein [Solobacterium sp.]|jgi:small conductance mechanosensitive channel|nr:mechanosensitive ion channel family protein [Solobacterium sp.]MCH4222236.1 mechanosensitive ion channel family protein [Solobacterium sp.]MCH4265756.1 mechanosensitive ion channel family protein [Solobacterium sp.]
MGRKKRFRHILIEAIILAVGVFILQSALNRISLTNNIAQQASDNETELNLVVQKVEAASDMSSENLDSFDSSASAKGNTIAYYLNSHEDGEAQLEGLASEWRLKCYVLLDSDGSVRLANDMSLDDHPEELNRLMNDLTPVTIDDTWYYTVKLNDGRTLLYCRDYSAEARQLSSNYSLDHVLSTLNVGNAGTITSINLDDGTITYSDQSALVGTSASDSGYDMELLTNGYSDVTELNGTEYYVTAKQTGRTMLIAAKSMSELKEKGQVTIRLILLIFAVIIALLIAYSDFIHRDLAAHPEKEDHYVHLFSDFYFDPAVGSKIRAVIIIGLCAEVILTFYLETLGPLSRQGTLSDSRLSAAETILESDEKDTESIQKEFKQDYTLLGQHLAYTLKLDPSMVNHQTPADLASCAHLKSIYVFDETGTVTAMSDNYRNFSLSTDPSAQSYPFWAVVNGTALSYVQDAEYDDLGDYVQFAGVQRQDANGMVQIGVDSSRLETRLQTTGLNTTLEGINIGQGGYLFAVNAESHEISAYPQNSMLQKSASSLGISDAAFKDNYSGFQTINGVSYFVNGFLYNDTDYIYAAIPLSVIYANRMPSTLQVALISFIIIMIIFCLLTISRNPRQERLEEEAELSQQQACRKPDTEAKGAPFFKRLRFSGTRKMTQSAISRYGETITWDEKTPEQKLWSVTAVILMTAAVALAVYLQLFRSSAMSNTIIYYIINRKWEKGFNLFSITYCIFSMTDIIVITWMIRMAIIYILSQFGSRSETVGHLLNSFLKYAAVIGGIFYCLNAFGLDAGTLLASAGILSLVIGLGAQSLISDILAGISIVFEGSFRVGDIVTIDGWRGEVVEIGIRTTKVRSAGNDIRIFNNAAISSVINMTKQYSYAMVDVGIDYGESLEHVESVLENELPNIKKKIPAIVTGPFYKGVTELGDSSVNLRILAQCAESDRVQVTRDLNREILLLFDRYHINIPFPQVVVNQPAAVQAQATRHEKAAADRFVSDQKEQSKGIQKD